MTTESERTYRRRLFATALPEDFPSSSMRESLSVLDREFGNVENLKYSDVISRLESNLLAAEVNLNRLLGRIMQLKRKEPTELLPDPSGNGVATKEATLPREIVFREFFGAVAKELERRGCLEKLRSDYRKNSFKLGLSAICHKSITSWTHNGTHTQIVGSTDDLHKVVNHAFVWMCTELGPVQADRILIAGVKVAEALPEAFDCSPREFL